MLIFFSLNTESVNLPLKTTKSPTAVAFDLIDIILTAVIGELIELVLTIELCVNTKLYSQFNSDTFIS